MQSGILGLFHLGNRFSPGFFASASRANNAKFALPRVFWILFKELTAFYFAGIGIAVENESKKNKVFFLGHVYPPV